MAVMDNFVNIYGAKIIDKKPRQEQFPMHIHNDYEVFCFLSGEAKYVVEGTIYPLHKGDVVLLRRSEIHRVLLQSDSEYRRLVMNFTPADWSDPAIEQMMLPFTERPLGKFNYYSAANLADTHLVYYMEKACATEDPHIRSAYLTVLLCEISQCFSKIRKGPETFGKNDLADVLQYINHHLTEDISLFQISQLFFISQSQLNRRFKNTIGSTVWNYITEKRLLLAKTMLDEGEKPTQVYLNCGFHDYTSFYRAYLSKFGFPPSKTSSFS